MGRRAIDAYPTMRLHKPTGRARVRIGGKTYWLGRWGSVEARVRLDELVAAYIASGRKTAEAATSAAVTSATPASRRPAPPALDPPAAGITVGELALAWLQDIQRTRPNFKGSSLWNGALAASRAIRPFATMPAKDFGSRALIECQRQLIETPVPPPPRKPAKGKGKGKAKPQPPAPPRFRTRRYVNDVIGRVRQMFNWGNRHELVTDDRLKALENVPAVGFGEAIAPDPEPRGPVTDDIVNKTLLHLTAEVAGLVMFLRLTGCRPSEAARLRMQDIHDRDQPVWRYVPPHHKTKHRGKVRHIPLGPEAQRIVLRHAAGLEDDEAIFKPRRSVPPRPASDTIPMEPRKPSPRVGEKFTKDALRIAIGRAADAAGVPHWTPYQLRYSRLREVRRQQGRDAVQAMAGHAHARMSDHYAPPEWEQAAAAALRSG